MEKLPENDLKSAFFGFRDACNFRSEGRRNLGDAPACRELMALSIDRKKVRFYSRVHRVEKPGFSHIGGFIL